MARVPRIESPCPLTMAEQLRIDGHCGRCNKTVHALDGLDDAQRHALFAAARGAICVSYRLPVKRVPALGVAMAAMLSASAVMAGQDCAETKPAFQSVDSAPVEQVVNLEEASKPADPVDMIFVGGIQSAEDAEWIDDGSVPDLPIVVETESGHLINTTVAISPTPKRP